MLRRRSRRTYVTAAIRTTKKSYEQTQQTRQVNGAILQHHRKDILIIHVPATPTTPTTRMAMPVPMEIGAEVATAGAESQMVLLPEHGFEAIRPTQPVEETSFLTHTVVQAEHDPPNPSEKRTNRRYSRSVAPVSARTAAGAI